MKIRHLSENEFQDYITDKSKLSQDLLRHLDSCPACQAELNAYSVIFTGVKNLERPAFDFDLSDFILEKIPVVKPQFPWVTYLVIFSAVLFFVITFVTFSSYLVQVFKTLPAPYFFILTVTALLVLLYQGFEAVKMYREKINRINSNQFLQ